MDFIDYVHLIFPLIGFEPCFLDQVSDIFDPIIRCSIDLDTVEHHPIIKCPTIHACMTRIAILEIGTVHSFREYASTRCFPRSTRTMKKIGMTRPSLSQAIAEDRRDVVLRDN